ncbi:MAG TPA: hypothetical protein ENJ43_03030 [Gammaproteobacteria bacterium]|nr:hypothetical protein [Gammaproteobacteria bacterium]
MSPPRKSHPSTRLGLLSLLTGLVGSAIAYLGLWIESDNVGLAGFGLVAVAVLGAVGSLLWNAIWVISSKWRG